MQVATDVLNVLEAAEISGNGLTLVGALDRKLYERTNKVLEAAGGKWSRKDRAHIFADDPADVIDQVILTGQIVVAKQEFGALYTPAEIAVLAAELCDIEGRHRLLEPSAGGGALVREALARGALVTAVELRPDAAEALRRDFAVECGIHEADFLRLCIADLGGYFDRVLMNPPFAKQADIAHVMHASLFLATGGRLVAIMSASVRFRKNTAARDFRDFVAERGGYFQDLPEGAFKASGTLVNTCIVVIPGEA